MLHIVGAGLPRTGTSSLRRALELLLGGDCLHMSAIPGHPFDLGPDWNRALAGGSMDWATILTEYVATVDWPASAFWRDIVAAHPRAKILLSRRDSAQTWLQSMEATVLPVARMATDPDWSGGRGLVELLERFTGTDAWDDPGRLTDCYERQLADVRESVPAECMIEWLPGDGWRPLCAGLDLEIPDIDFPWLNRREDW